MLDCIFSCLRAIPWWAWLILSIVAIVLAIVGWIFGGPWGAVAGLLGPFALTMLYCLQGCSGAPRG